jgi:putative Mg2+ transporter-C (MgtC) family protein
MAIVALGSALFTEISLQTADADRIAAGIVSGIGFLGAGVIFREGYSVKGITTAATIWGAAALGMAVARELYLVATLAAVLIFFILESRTAVQWANNVLRGRAASITGREDDGERDDKREHDER